MLKKENERTAHLSHRNGSPITRARLGQCQIDSKARFISTRNIGRHEVLCVAKSSIIMEAVFDQAAYLL